MALQHLRSGTANKRPIPTVMSAGQIAINTNEASPGLFFKDSNGDLVKVGPVHIGTTAPNSSPDSVAATALVTGTVYQILTVGTSDFTLVGASANTVGVIFTATGTTTGDGTVSGQQGVEKGEMWLDTTGGNYVLKIYDGTAWRSEAGEFVNVTGDTMTGDLVFNNADIVFEGATADDFETTLTVVDPTADRTITLPDTTGTVVTTGDTGTVTSTMITDGTIVNADINASAEIAVSKLADGAARQLLQTDAAGTGVEWASNIDIPGTLDVTSAATFDSTVTATGLITANGKVSFPAGTAAAPSLYSGTDIDTGVYSPGANQFGVATAGTSRLVIDSSGNVGIGTTSVDRHFHVEGTDNVQGKFQNNSTLCFVEFEDSNTTAGNRPTIGSTGNNLAFWTGGSESARIDSSGNVGIGTTSPAVKTEIVGGSAGVETNLLQLRTNSSNVNTGSGLRFTNSTSNSADTASAEIVYKRTNSPASGAGDLIFNITNGTSLSERMRIDSSGRVGVGTTSPGANLELKENATSGTNHPMQIWRTAGGGFMQLRVENLGLSQPYHEFTTGTGEDIVFNPGGNVGIGTTSPAEALEVRTGTANVRIRSNDAGSDCDLRFMPRNSGGTSNWNSSITGIEGALTFGVGASANAAPTEAMRIDSSGRLLVGTSSVNVSSTVVLEGRSGATTSEAILRLCRGQDTPADGATLGDLSFGDSNNGDAARIFAQRDGGTWTSASSRPSRLVFSTTADGASSPTERMRISSAGTVTLNGDDPSAAVSSAKFFQIAGSSSSSGAKFESKATSTSTRHHFAFTYSTSTIGSITTSGSATAYNTSSDYRLKENVVDISDGITRVKQLQPKRFNFIVDPDTTVDGFLAHEAQTVVPEAVTGTHNEVDDDGNAVMQGIDQSKLVPLLTAALQEAIGKIETLEAKVAALEAS